MPTTAAQKSAALGAARGAVLAMHSAASLALPASREAARLLRTAEGLARTAVATLQAAPTPSPPPTAAAPRAPRRRRRPRGRRAEAKRGAEEGLRQQPSRQGAAGAAGATDGGAPSLALLDRGSPCARRALAGSSQAPAEPALPALAEKAVSEDDQGDGTQGKGKRLKKSAKDSQALAGPLAAAPDVAMVGQDGPTVASVLHPALRARAQDLAAEAMRLGPSTKKGLALLRESEELTAIHDSLG